MSASLAVAERDAAATEMLQIAQHDRWQSVLRAWTNPLAPRTLLPIRKSLFEQVKSLPQFSCVLDRKGIFRASSNTCLLLLFIAFIADS
jgi:hypothetical protein